LIDGENLQNLELIDRDVLKEIIPWLSEREILVLLGARQVGKTSLLRLLQNHVKDNPVIYLDLESAFDLAHAATPEKLVDYLFSQRTPKDRRVYCFIDEIQYHPEPTHFLKILHDHHPNIKLAVSGSSSFAIRQKFKDALTGRKQIFHVAPLHFAEFLRFKKHPEQSVKESLTLDTVLADFSAARKFHSLTPQILPLWEEFVVYGGYPRPSLTADTSMKQARLREIYNSYVQKDIKDLARIDNVVQFNQLVNFLAVQISQLFRVDEVSKEVGLPASRLNKYLLLLENTFIISRLRPYHSNRQKELTRMPKLYFCDTGLRNTGLSDFRDLSMRPDGGALAENQCLLELLRRAPAGDDFFFWRTWDKSEVDFIRSRKRRDLLPLEVKYQSLHQPKTPPALRNFMRIYGCSTGIVVTKDYFGEAEADSQRILFVPAWML
jgi:hypothetical protein